MIGRDYWHNTKNTMVRVSSIALYGLGHDREYVVYYQYNNSLTYVLPRAQFEMNYDNEPIDTEED